MKSESNWSMFFLSIFLGAGQTSSFSSSRYLCLQFVHFVLLVALTFSQYTFSYSVNLTISPTNPWASREQRAPFLGGVIPQYVFQIISAQLIKWMVFHHLKTQQLFFFKWYFPTKMIFFPFSLFSVTPPSWNWHQLPPLYPISHQVLQSVSSTDVFLLWGIAPCPCVLVFHSTNDTISRLNFWRQS